MKLTGETEVLGEKPVPVPLCPPQIPHGPIRDQTRASAVRGRRLAAWAMAGPNVCFLRSNLVLVCLMYLYSIFYILSAGFFYNFSGMLRLQIHLDIAIGEPAAVMTYGGGGYRSDRKDSSYH